MTNEELAAEVLRILGWHSNIRQQAGYRSDSQFVCHWSVAGAMLEKAIKDTGLLPSQWFCPNTDEKLFGVMFEDSNGRSVAQALDSSLSRAINEVCVKVLKNVSN